MKRRLLFAWELGAGTGHVSPCLPLLKRLQARGWDIIAAVRDTREVADVLRPLGIPMLQAPVSWHQLHGASSASYNYTETLLHFGYGDARSLRGLVEAWVSLSEFVKPDVILCSAAPTMQFVAQSQSLPHAIIGSGYNCPPPTDPLPLMRDWTPGVEQRLQNVEATVSSVLTAVREQVFDLAGPYSTQKLMADSSALLCTFRDLDHYPARSAESTYYGILTARRYATERASEFEVFAYVRHSAQSTALFAALASAKLRALVYCPDAPAEVRQRHQGERLTITDKPVRLETVLGGCRFVIGYGSHHLTAEALLAGKPLLLLPVHLEQELTGRAVERMGAGISTAGRGRKVHFSKLIAQLCNDGELRTAAERFAANQDNWQADEAADALADRCERIHSDSFVVPRKVVAL